MVTDETPVLIVGGGPVGLTAAIALGRHGVRSLLVERHPGTSIHPKARIINVRTMEVFRTWGLEESVREAGRDLATARDAVWMTSLNGTVLRRFPTGGDPSRIRADSPTTPCSCTQDALEPVLLEKARRTAGVSLQFGHELVALKQDVSATTATILDLGNRTKRTVRASYVIAADGAKSSIRQTLGIPMIGSGVAAHAVGIYFEANLADVMRDRAALVYMIKATETAPLSGVFGAVNNADRWAFMVRYDPERGESPEDFTEARCVELVRRAAGIPNLDVAVRSVLPWTAGQAVAEHYKAGRLFLAGDAAHTISPTGGEAMNVGIQDVHNLAWKLALVLSDRADPGLLDTYEAERQPAARLIGERALSNAGTGGRREIFDNEGLVLGLAYESAGIVPDGTPPPDVGDAAATYVPTARPGHRAPHVWLDRGGQRISTVDLFDTAFVLLAGVAGRPWCQAARAIAVDLGMPLETYVVGPDGDLGDVDHAWERIYGVENGGAVLVRPDGYVAWRGRGEDRLVEHTLAHVMSRILGRNS